MISSVRQSLSALLGVDPDKVLGEGEWWGVDMAGVTESYDGEGVGGCYKIHNILVGGGCKIQNILVGGGAKSIIQVYSEGLSNKNYCYAAFCLCIYIWTFVSFSAHLLSIIHLKNSVLKI